MQRARPYLGTLVEIGSHDDLRGSKATLQKAINAAFEAISDIEKRLSFHSLTSELHQLNSQPGKWVRMHRHSLRVLRIAKRFGQLSREHFNCTVGGQLVRRSALPCHVNHEFLDCGSSNDIDIGNNAAKLNKSILVTLDGIAKGYAVDYACYVLQKFGIDGGWVNAGGDLRCFGDSGLTIRQRTDKGIYGRLQLKNCALASSRLADKPSQEFPSLLITQSKESSSLERIISIQAKSAWRADALTKVAASAPLAERDSLIQQLGGSIIHFSTAPKHESTSA